MTVVGLGTSCSPSTNAFHQQLNGYVQKCKTLGTLLECKSQHFVLPNAIFQAPLEEGHGSVRPDSNHRHASSTISSLEKSRIHKYGAHFTLHLLRASSFRRLHRHILWPGRIVQDLLNNQLIRKIDLPLGR
ncbi:hypothetical protein Mapa_010392 [Marchantia paleacea]|nr:hypothetical protein Mapa_010392 [Marchantia paleacea]